MDEDPRHEVASAAYDELFSHVEQAKARGKHIKPTVLVSTGDERFYVPDAGVDAESLVRTRDEIASHGADWAAIVAEATFHPDEAPSGQRMPYDAVVFEIRVGKALFVASCPIDANAGELRKGELGPALDVDTILSGGGYLH